MAVPALPEFNLQYSFKNDKTLRGKRVPPKPNKSASTSRLGLYYSPIAKPIEFRHGLRSLPLSPTYKQSLGVSYMQQCFDDVTYLGEGSYGVVFRALSKDDGKYYAVKKFRDKFRNQAHRTARLDEVSRYGSVPQSEYCVEMIRAWEEDAHLFIQMELCSVSLEQYIRESRIISEEMMWNILLDLLLGVQHLHSHQFVHLDIKPDNILMSSNNIFKLGDFGLMLDLSNGNIDDAEEGDSRYLAPEVLNGVFSKAADIFSIGITMLEIACNIQLPTSGPLWQELRHGNLPSQHFNGTSGEFFEFVKSMMTPDHSERPSVDLLLQHKKINTLQRTRLVHSVLQNLASRLKEWYTYGKTVAANYTLGMLRPLSSRGYKLPWYRQDGRVPINNGGIPSASSSNHSPGVSYEEQISLASNGCLRRVHVGSCRKSLQSPLFWRRRRGYQKAMFK